MDLRDSDRRPSNIVLNCTVLGQDERAILCDVSPTGCRIELFDGTAPQRGATIVFEVEDPLYFAGEIVWARGTEAGVRFSRPLSPQVREALEV